MTGHTINLGDYDYSGEEIRCLLYHLKPFFNTCTGDQGTVTYINNYPDFKHVVLKLGLVEEGDL